jgi:transcriptional regulator with XRE-family HTH domain
MNVIDRIQSLLQARGVPRRSVRRELANTCEISYEAVRQWFSGDTANIRNEHLVSIARKYKVTVDWLLSGDPSELNKPDTAQERVASYQAARAEALDGGATSEPSQQQIGVNMAALLNLQGKATPRSLEVLKRIEKAAIEGRLQEADLIALEGIAARFEQLNTEKP